MGSKSSKQTRSNRYVKIVCFNSYFDKIVVVVVVIEDDDD